MSFNPSKCQVLHVTLLKTPIPSKYSLHNKEQESVSAAKYLEVTISDNLNWGSHLDNITKKANQTLGFLKRNIKVHNQDLKSTAYKTLIQPQLEYAPTAWPHTLLLTYTNFNLFNAGLPGGLLTSSVTTMLGNLNWRILDQRRIDSRLVTPMTLLLSLHMHLIPNRRESKFIHPLTYKQIPTSTNYSLYYKYSFFPRTIVHWSALPSSQPALSCSLTWHSLVILFARWCMYPPYHQILLLTILTLFSHCTNSSNTLCLFFFSTSPP